MIPIESKEFHLAKSNKWEGSYHLGPKETDHSLSGLKWPLSLSSLSALFEKDNVLILIHQLTCLPTFTGGILHRVTTISWSHNENYFEGESIILVLFFFIPPSYATGQRIRWYRQELKGKANIPMRKLQFRTSIPKQVNQICHTKELELYPESYV